MPPPFAYGFALRFIGDTAMSSHDIEARLRPAVEAALAEIARDIVFTPTYRQPINRAPPPGQEPAPDATPTAPPAAAAKRRTRKRAAG